MISFGHPIRKNDFALTQRKKKVPKTKQKKLSQKKGTPNYLQNSTEEKECTEENAVKMLN